MTDKVVYTFCFLVTKILHCTGFSVRVCIFWLRGRKAYHYRYTNIMVDIYKTVLLLNNILYLTIFSGRPSISELEALHIFKFRGQKAHHDGHAHMYIFLS